MMKRVNPDTGKNLIAGNIRPNKGTQDGNIFLDYDSI